MSASTVTTPVHEGTAAGLAEDEAKLSPIPPCETRVSAARRCLGRQDNWLQLMKFSLVGGTGYAVNLACYSALLLGVGFGYLVAATFSFVVAATNNYVWNRLWTFRTQRGHLGYQGLRFFAVSTGAYGANLVLLSAFVAGGLHKVAGQALAIILVTPLNFVGNKLWSFRRA